MKKIHKIFIVLLLSALAICQKSFAKETPVKNLYEYNLENGLTVFTAENHSVPLVYIEIAVRTGATSQTPENAGLFHLYEHMMFKGNSLYKDAASMNRALSDLGVSNWNGSTGTDCVNYFFTIPSDKVVEGLEFWNAAIRSPLMNETEFENEKKVVLSEINGSLSEPLQIYGHFINFKMFPDAPYRTDSGGSLEVIQNATVNQLRAIQKEFYVPSNAAVFVGGDINPEQIYELTKEIFGSWKNYNQKITIQNQQNLKPFQNDEFYFMPYDKLPENLAEIEIYFRGPDTDFDIQDTYAADYLLMLLNEPNGIFNSYFSSLADFKLYKNMIWASYGTSRASGIYGFGATVSSTENIASRANFMINDLRTKILPQIANDKSLFSKKTKNRIVEKLYDEQLSDSETPSALLSKIRFWWCCSSPQYYYNYIEDISKVSQKDVQNFIQKYLSSPAMIVILANSSVSTEDFVETENFSASTKNPLESKKITKITEENAFWWKDENFAVNAGDFWQTKDSSVNAENFARIEDSAVSTKNSVRTEDSTVSTKNFARIQNSNINTTNSAETENLFASTEDYNQSEKNQIQIKKTEYVPPKIETYYLKNKIPVYIQQNSSHNLEIAFAVRGGVENLTKETSGLESSLFNLMSLSSKKFSQKELDALSYKTGMSFTKTNKMTGSAFGISVLDKYLKETFPVLTSAFLNPEFTQGNFEHIQTQIQSHIKNIKNDVQTMLSYEIQQELYKNHPYEISTLVTLDSAQNITLENLQKHHEKILDAGKIFVVAVGSFDSKWLVKELNKTLGKLKVLGNEIHGSLSYAFTQETDSSAQPSASSSNKASVDFKNPPSLKIQNAPDVILKNPSANGTGFVARVFASPSNTSSEYIPAAICANIFSDVLFNVVREHYGACYSPSSYVVGSKAPYGAEYIYRLSDFENYKKYMEEARNYMAQNKLIEEQNQNGEYVFTSIENRLEGYKNSYINSTYASYETSEGLALKLIYNLLQFNDINYDLIQLEQVRNLTADDIQNVFKKYWLSPNTRWFMVFGEN